MVGLRVEGGGRWIQQHQPTADAVPAEAAADGVCGLIETIQPLGTVDIRRAASLKAGGLGWRYTCRIHGQERCLYREDDGRWFVEMPTL